MIREEGYERTLKKINNNTYEFREYTPSTKHLTVKEYTKDELKKIHSEISTQKRQAIMAKNGFQKDLERYADLEDTPELREILEKMELATKLSKKKEIEDKIDAANSDFLEFSNWTKEIENVIPELTRQVKK